MKTMRQKLWFPAIVAALMMPAMAGAQQGSQSSSQSAPTSQSSDKQATSQSTAKPASQATAAQQPESLAEAARKARAAEKTAPKAPMVFTNDNIPTVSTGVSVVGQGAASSSEAAGTNATSATPAAGGDEAAWRQKFADARHKIDQDKQELAVMQRELGELNVQYYPNPTQALMQSISRSDIDKKQAAIDAKQKQLAADQQALSDLQDELRKAGGDPGWARE